jgi:hypothetical protein
VSGREWVSGGALHSTYYSDVRWGEMWRASDEWQVIIFIWFSLWFYLFIVFISLPHTVTLMEHTQRYTHCTSSVTPGQCCGPPSSSSSRCCCCVHILAH